MLLIGLGALASILVLRERADQRQHAQVVLEQLRRQLSDIPGVGVGVTPGRGVNALLMFRTKSKPAFDAAVACLRPR